MAEFLQVTTGGGLVATTTTVVLAGGLGTRLRPAVGTIPKVLAEVNGRPFLDHVLSELRLSGVRDVVLAVGYGARSVQEFCQDGRAWDLEVRYSVDADEPLGTGGAVRQARSLVRSDPFLVVNGDSWVSVSLEALVAFHLINRAGLTMVVTRVGDRARYGTVDFGGAGQVQSFAEKSSTGAGWINAGVYVLSRHVLDCNPGGRRQSLEDDVLPALSKGDLFAFRSEGPFIDIGTPDALLSAAALLHEREAARTRHNASC